nr:MAG TPA: hypothetical protein [Caudoviricetes sp.]
MKFNINEIKDTQALDINVEIVLEGVKINEHVYPLSDSEKQLFIVNLEKVASSVKADETAGVAKSKVNASLLVSTLLLLSGVATGLTKGDLVAKYYDILSNIKQQHLHDQEDTQRAKGGK